MIRLLLACFLGIAALAPAQAAVRTYQGTLTIPTDEHIGREMQPPLFANSSVTGMYPFTTYLAPFKPGPNPHAYHAIFLENKYLKLTYIPDFGCRIFSVYDKLRHREMLYRNDVIKPAPYNPRYSWISSGMELTGPRDLHTLTLHKAPYWAHKIVRHQDGSISLVLGETDPVYGMRVDFTATLHPGIDALQITVFCFNPHDSRKPQMFWVNTAINATPKTRFIYPMTRTVGHTTAEIANWPMYHGIDLSWDRNNKHMLGVFGIDIYDNFQGAYQFDRDYGILRYADRRIGQGMKLWTFGYGPAEKGYEEGYTDHAGPYDELQSGRYVWDGHYEWVQPHKTEGWSEWWIPVSHTGGLTTLTRDVALKLDVHPDPQGANSVVRIALSATRVVPRVRLSVKAKCGKLLDEPIDLDPAKPFHTEVSGIHAASDGLTHMVVSITDAASHKLLDYHRPDSNPGGKEYTPFTKPLVEPHKTPDEMSVEELTLAAEYQLKDLNVSGAKKLLARALRRDPGYSRAHLLLGISDFNRDRFGDAAKQLTKVIQRDPYDYAAYFYLSMSEFVLGEKAAAERNLYYIPQASAYYGEREYHLGILSFQRRHYNQAVEHFRHAVGANSDDLSARLALAVVLREQSRKAAALKELNAVEKIDPTNRPVWAERWFLTGDEADRAELLRLTGGQTQEAIAVTTFYRNLGQWKQAARILQLIGDHSQDPWGTTPVFYYTLAYCQRRAGNLHAADASLAKARAAAGKVDRFPYRRETEVPLAEAVRLDPNDVTARFDLACLRYFRGQPKAAIKQWKTVLAIDPRDFSSLRALGLAYAEQGFPIDQAIAQLQHAVALNPAHLPTLDDLSAMYARAGLFQDQLALLKKALQRFPTNDDLADGVLTSYLNMGSYRDAERVIETHHFATRHRSYGLRDQYRLLRCGMGAQAFRRGDYRRALQLFESAFHPPVSLGVDTFADQPSPRIEYYIGRTLDALDEKDQARGAYEKSIAGLDQLSGDRDSWSSDNFLMVLSLDRLGRSDEATHLEKHFSDFAETEHDSKSAQHRAAALYLLALVSQHDRHPEQARRLLKQALAARPDLLAARLALRGDVINPLPEKN